MSVADLTGRLKEAEEAFEEALTSLQQDGKLYLTEEEWDAWRKKSEAENHSGVVVVVTIHQAGRRESQSVTSVGAAARWGIGRVSAARSPGRSRHTSRKMRRRPRSCSRRQP
jgi:hypothetical protein